jgi:hypothetical protein
MELFTIVVGNVCSHKYWHSGAFVALCDSDWGPSPTLRIVNEPSMFLTFKEANDVLDMYNHYGIEMNVVTFTRKQ